MSVDILYGDFEGGQRAITPLPPHPARGQVVRLGRRGITGTSTARSRASASPLGLAVPVLGRLAEAPHEDVVVLRVLREHLAAVGVFDELR